MAVFRVLWERSCSSPLLLVLVLLVLVLLLVRVLVLLWRAPKGSGE